MRDNPVHVSCKQVSKQVGRAYKAVWARRNHLGIRCVPIVRHWSSEKDALLGKLTDEELAQRLGRTFCAVKVRRTQKGIPKRTH
jgi:hypothetical protein